MNLSRALPSLLLGLALSVGAIAQPTEHLKLASWNIQDLGRTKSPEDIALMAAVLRGYDVIAVQEVVARDPAGAQAVARLAEALDRTGSDYDYRVSDPTRSSSGAMRERYAFLWRTASVALVGRPKLLSAYAKTIEREPYLATFAWGGRRFRVATFHGRPHDAHPEQEVARLRGLPDDYDDAPLFLAGDFNLVSRHTVWNPWRERGYGLAVEDQQTTLRTEAGPDDPRDIFSREADNILVPAHQVRHIEGGLLDVPAFLRNDLAAARRLSDHVPVYVVFGEFP